MVSGGICIAMLIPNKAERGMCEELGSALKKTLQKAHRRILINRPLNTLALIASIEHVYRKGQPEGAADAFSYLSRACRRAAG
jgi:hypothetical protein